MLEIAPLLKTEEILLSGDLSSYSIEAIRSMAMAVWPGERGSKFWKDIYTKRLDADT